jgi:hypothetical protein
MACRGRQARAGQCGRFAILTVAAVLLAATFLVLATADSRAQSYGERDTGFKIILKHRSVQPVGLEASIVSTATYPCAGCGIRGSAWASGDTIVLVIHGMVRPSPCVSLPSEAAGTVYLGELPRPTSVLRITYRGDTDLHRISRSGGRVTISPIRSRFTRLSGN